MTTLAVDSLVRANQSGLGTASDGTNTWGSITNGATANVTSNEAVISNCVTGFPIIFLGSKTTANINFVVRCNQVNNVFDGIGPCFRAVDANNLYFVAFYAGSGGLVFAKMVGGGFNSIASGSFTLTDNTFVWMRIIMSGNHLQVFAWNDGGSQPGTPQIDTTDSTYTSAGLFGMSFNQFGSSSDVAKFDTITVTDNASATQVTKDVSGRARVASSRLRDITSLVRSQATALSFLASRLRLASPSTFRDIAARYLLSIQRLRDVSALTNVAAVSQRNISARVEAAAATLQSVATRSRLQSQAVLHFLAARTLVASQVIQSVSARLVTLASTNRSLAARLITQSGILRDAASRFLLQSQLQLRSISTRFPLASTLLTSVSTRIKSLANASQNISSRVKAQATTNESVSGRELLQASPLRSLSLRLLFSSTALFRSVSARFVILSGQELNLATLFRSQALAARSLAARSLLQVTQLPALSARLLLNLNRTVSTRTKLAASRTQDVAALTQLAALQTRSLASRLITQGLSPHNIAALLALSAQRLASVAARVPLLARQVTQIPSRLLVLSQQSGALSARVRSQVTTLLSASTRVRSAPGATLNLALRTFLVNIGIEQSRTLFLRFILKKPPMVYSVGSWSSMPSAFLAGSVITVPRPVSSYQWNGVALDMPSVRTAPMDKGKSIPVGSTFTLLFENPSVATQTQLTSGSTGMLTFAVSAAAMVQGMVRLEVVITDSIWQVFATTLAPILVKTGV